MIQCFEQQHHHHHHHHRGIPCMVVSHNKSSPSSITSQNKSIQWKNKNNNNRPKQEKKDIESSKCEWYVQDSMFDGWMNVAIHWIHRWNVIKITFLVFESLQQWISFGFDEPKICCNSNNSTGHFKSFSWSDQDTYERIYRKIISNRRAERVSVFAPILGKCKCVCCVCGFNQWMNERSNGQYYNLRRETNEWMQNWKRHKIRALCCVFQIYLKVKRTHITVKLANDYGRYCCCCCFCYYYDRHSP